MSGQEAPSAASNLPSYDVTELVSFVEQPDGSMTVEPRLLLGVAADLERHIALRDAFRKVMEVER